MKKMYMMKKTLYLMLLLLVFCNQLLAQSRSNDEIASLITRKWAIDVDGTVSMLSEKQKKDAENSGFAGWDGYIQQLQMQAPIEYQKDGSYDTQDMMPPQGKLKGIWKLSDDGKTLLVSPPWSVDSENKKTTYDIKSIIFEISESKLVLKQEPYRPEDEPVFTVYKAVQ